MFTAELRQLVGVTERGRIGEQSFDFGGTLQRAR
jgi:hypothetical protein